MEDGPDENPIVETGAELGVVEGAGLVVGTVVGAAADSEQLAAWSAPY